MDEYTAEELERANEALADAAVLRNSGSKRGVVNRLYYACFHAARAALHTKGFDPDTHAGVLTLFGREIVEQGDATGADGRFLNRMESYRSAADYEHTRIEKSTEVLFERAEVFVSDMDEIVK